MTAEYLRMTTTTGPHSRTLLAAALLCCGYAPAIAAQPAVPSDLSVRLQEVLEASSTALGAPGAAAAVILSSGQLWSGAAGTARPNDPVTTETAFELGSVTKTYTAAVVLQLVSEGRLELTARLSEWWPELPNADAVTVEHLLRHTHGLHDPLQEPDYVPSVLAAPARVWTLEDVLARMKEPHFAPGGGWRYSNTGFHLLGALVGQVADAAFGDVLGRRLFGPLGLRNTWYGHMDPPGADLAAAYIDPSGSGSAQPVSLLMEWTAFRTSGGPAGAVVATATDAARWLHALATGGVLTDAMWERMTSWVERPDGHRYGLGLLRLEGNADPLLGHKGNSAGYSVAVFHDPASGVTAAVLTNAHAVDVTPAVLALLDVIRAR